MSSQLHADPIESFRAAIAAAGLTQPDRIIADGEIHRFASNGKASDHAGWYVFYLGDHIPAGAFGCWRANISEKWQANIGRNLSPAEKREWQKRMAEATKKRDEEERERHEQAAQRAKAEWDQAQPAGSDHPYLKKKGINPNGLRVTQSGQLLVPMLKDGKIRSLQFISGDGEKRFLPGGEVKGCYVNVGTRDEALGHGAFAIAEGVATACSIYQSVDGMPTIVAFNAGNLLSVAQKMREKYPLLKLIIAADDDVGTKNNPGLTKAREAAAAVRGLVAVPDFGSDRPAGVTDFNDLARLKGAEAVKYCILSAMQPEQNEPPIFDDDEAAPSPPDTDEVQAQPSASANEPETQPASTASEGAADVKEAPELKELPRSTLVDAAAAPIRLIAGELHNIAEECERTLGATGHVFTRGRKIVRVDYCGSQPGYGKPSGFERPVDQPVVVAASVEWVQREITKIRGFKKYNARNQAWIPTDCPLALAGNIIGVGSWPTLPGLRSIASAPFLRRDLSLCRTPGYDRESQIYLALTAEFLSIADNPTKDDAAAALRLLMEPFNEFPFTPAGRSALLSHILTCIARTALPTVPVFFYTAPTAGSGKTLLARLPGVIATGVSPTIHPWAETPEEQRKVVLSALIAGDTNIILDNIQKGTRVRSDVICGLSTAESYSDRVLGRSEIVSLPNTLTPVLTGNNINPAGDLARRSLICRVDANCERPQDRTFSIKELEQYIRERWTTLAVAALTVIRAYVAAGMPEQKNPIGSFVQWSRVCRNPLLWLGEEDPVSTQETEADDDQAALANAFVAIKDHFGIGKPFLASQIITETSVVNGKTLKEALADAGCIEPEKVGYFLRRYKGRIAGGLKLDNQMAQNHTPKWVVREIRT
jgi:putative DNA primase/helicase